MAGEDPGQKAWAVPCAYPVILGKWLSRVHHLCRSSFPEFWESVKMCGEAQSWWFITGSFIFLPLSFCPVWPKCTWWILCYLEDFQNFLATRNLRTNPGYILSASGKWALSLKLGVGGPQSPPHPQVPPAPWQPLSSWGALWGATDWESTSYSNVNGLQLEPRSGGESDPRRRWLRPLRSAPSFPRWWRGPG